MGFDLVAVKKNKRTQKKQSTLFGQLYQVIQGSPIEASQPGRTAAEPVLGGKDLPISYMYRIMVYDSNFL